MTYREKIVCCVKVNGRVLRESDDTVTLPFGSEYSVLVKNLDSVRIKIKVSIDGQDATEGTHLIIQPNTSLELERFIKNGNLGAGNRFKFIERSAAVEGHRGIKVDDGIVRVEAWAEIVQIITTTPVVHYYEHHYWPYHWNYRYPYVIPQWPPTEQITTCNTVQTRSGGTTSSSFLGALQSTNTSADMNSLDAGITVPGSESHQQFTPTLGFQTEAQSRVIVLKLRGQAGGLKARKAITVKTKPQCVTCGKKNRPDARFCTTCGTALTIV